MIAEELGRAVAPIPFASTVYFLAEAVMLAGNDGAEGRAAAEDRRGRGHRRHGDLRGPGRAHRRRRCKATVSGGKLTGVKLPVTDGDIANVALVLAKENGQPGLFLVDLGRRGRDPRGAEDPGPDPRRGAG